MDRSRSGSERRRVRPPSMRASLGIVALTLLALTVLSVAPAFAEEAASQESTMSAHMARQAAAGELFFYPCTDCHPVNPNTGQPVSGQLPIEFEGHEIVLGAHQVLGEESAACLACHDDPGRDPGQLKTVDGSLVDISGDVSLVCQTCHSNKYNEFQAGAHGREEDACTAAGCHDPHTPRWIYAPPLPPFVGSGFLFKGVGETEPFLALPPPAPEPGTTTPTWFALLATLGVVVTGVGAFGIYRGGRKR